MSKGYIYILINPSLQKDLLKIGKTTRTPDERSMELSSSTGVATSYYVAYEAETDNCDQAEALIHKELAKFRYKEDREFFKIPLKTAIPIVEKISLETKKLLEENLNNGEKSQEQENAETYFYLGENEFEAGNYKDAIDAYKEAIRINPEQDGVYSALAEAYYKLGENEFEVGNYKEAIDAYKESIRINPDHADAYCSLGAGYYKIGLNEEAEKTVKEVLNTNPEHARALSFLGAIFYDANQYDKAINSLKKALSIDPDMDGAYNTLGAIYYSKKHYEKAIEAFKKALNIKPDKTEYHYNLGICYSQFDKPGNKHAARKHLEVLYKLDKNKANELAKEMSPFGFLN